MTFEIVREGYADSVTFIGARFDLSGPHVILYENGTVDVQNSQAALTTHISNVYIFWAYEKVREPAKIMKLVPKGAL